MPVRFSVVPQRNLVIFTYFGEVSFQEVIDVVAAATTHPLHRAGMRQLCDMSQVTGVERDFPALMKMQARIAEDLMPKSAELLVLFYAPTEIGQEIAQMARRSWEGLNSVIVVVQQHEAEALALFGLPETSFDALNKLLV